METVLYLSVTGSKIKAMNAIEIMSNSENWYKCSFSFDSTWDSLSKTAVFSNDKKVCFAQALTADNTCYIPALVLKQGGYLYIGVVHRELLDEENMAKLPTEWTFVTVREGVDSGQALPPPDQDVYESILRNTTQAYAYAADVENRANNGDFTATVALGTVTTGESGSDTVITNSGTEQDAVFNFTLPRGIQGDQGIQGVQGTIGPRGATGNSLEYLWNGTQLGVRVEGDPTYTYVDLKGAIGTQGVQGIQGEAGTSAYLHIRWGTSATPATLLTTPNEYIGVCASASSTAPADYSGYCWYQWKGIQGATGAQGEQGEKGDKGDTGNTGMQGPAGLNWLGAYSAATTYAVDDAVSYNGSSYICILASMGNLPTNATYWQVLAAKGTDGAGAGDMLASVYDPTGVEGDAFDMDKMVSGTTNKVYTATEQSKLISIAAGANNYIHPETHSADMIVDGTTNKTYTATEQTKLAGIAVGAEVNVNADWNAASGGAQILNKPATFTPAAHNHSASEVTDFDTEVSNNTDVATNTSTRHTHSNTAALSNVSGINTGDETTATIGSLIRGALAKTTPADDDMVALMDSEASDIVKKLSITDLQSAIGGSGTPQITFSEFYTSDSPAKRTTTSLEGTGAYVAAASTTSYAVFAGGYISSSPYYRAYVSAYDEDLTRTLPTDLSSARGHLAAATIGSYILFGGGTNASSSNVVDAYDASLTRSTPTTLSAARGDLSGITIGAYALFAGGTGDSTVVDAYDSNLTRSTAIVLGTGRYLMAAATVGYYALFAGGKNSSNTYGVNNVDVYDTDLTHTTTTLSVSRLAMGSGSNQNYALFAGGETSNGQTTANAFDDSLTRTTPTSLTQGRGYMGCAYQAPYILLAGGDNSGTSQYNYVDSYDESLTYHSESALTTTTKYLAGASIGIYAIFAGGYNGSSYVSTAYAYNSYTASIPIPSFHSYKFAEHATEQFTVGELAYSQPYKISGYIKYASKTLTGLN